MPRLADGGLGAAVGHRICPGLTALDNGSVVDVLLMSPDQRAGELLVETRTFQRSGKTLLLEHYVFDDEDPAAHIPADRRGILGPLTPGQLAELRETIRRYL